MLNDSIHCLVVFKHLLMVATTLLMRTSNHHLAHYSIQMPFSLTMLTSLQHLPKLQQETHITLILNHSPMRCQELLTRNNRVL
jgi:hypothetical protein